MRKKLFMMLLYVLSVIFAGCGKEETESLESIEKEEIKQIMEDDVLQDGDISETKNIPENDDVTSEDNDIRG